MRERMTWKEGSAPPAMPTEDGGHPASQPDPDATKYEKGSPSEWAEDPTKGPYPNSAPPAMPAESGDHPAAKAASLDIRVAAEQKAAKCIRIAQALLGKNADAVDIESQAFPFMHLADEHVDATLARISRLAGECEEDEKEDEKKEASTDRLAALETAVGELVREFKALREAGFYGLQPQSMTAEQMYAEMLKAEEPAPAPAMSEAEMMKQILMELKKTAADKDEEEEDEDVKKEAADDKDEEDEDVKKEAADDKDEEEEEEDVKKEAAWDIELGSDEDAMGLTASITENDSVLASLYAGAKEEEEEEEEEEVQKTARLNLRPQPRSPAKGAQTLGVVGMERTASGEINDLSKLWETSPDVSAHFSK